MYLTLPVPFISDGRLLHAGPSRNMHWIDVKGDGAVTHIGPRGDDEDSMCGNAVVYDIGKVLKLGGSPRLNHRNPANNQAYVIDVNGADDPVVTRVDDMHYARGNVNSVVLPNGEVLVVGGQTKAKGISDMYSALVCEIWSPETQKFTLLDGMLRIPRNYHSTALLLRDGRVITAGQNVSREFEYLWSKCQYSWCSVPSHSPSAFAVSF